MSVANGETILLLVTRVMEHLGDALALCRTAAQTFKTVVQWPLRTLYLSGPWLGGYGFWNGRSPADICTILNRAPGSLWEREGFEICLRMVEDQTVAFVVGCNTTLACLLVLYLVVRFMCCRPIATWVQGLVMCDDKPRPLYRIGMKKTPLSCNSSSGVEDDEEGVV